MSRTERWPSCSSFLLCYGQPQPCFTAPVCLATDFSSSTIHLHEKAPAVRPRLVDLEWAKHTPVSSVPSLDGKCVLLETTKTPASSWSDALRASCGSNSYPGRLCSKIASTQIGVGQGQSDHCTCRIGVCQFSLTLERTSAILTNCSPHRYQRRRAFRGNVLARQKPRALI
jgi:hypothetical protein